MRSVLLVALFLSGFAALVYQVIWQRLLVIFSGADVYSITIIVAAFMGGLGVGSLAGGRLADRIGSRSCLWAFAIAELLVGLFGLSSKTLYYDLLYLRFPFLAGTPAIAAIVLFSSLFVPTFLMGVALPLLGRALTDRVDATGRVVGSLYGWNTLGAATGAFVGTWLLLPRLGLEGSLWIGATANFAAAALAVVFVRGVAFEATRPASPPETHISDGSLSFEAWVLIYGLTGFMALALEVVWFRLLGVMLKSNAFTFGTLLGVYLSGLGLGAVLAARPSAHSRHPGSIFLVLQYCLALYAALSIVALIALLDSGHPIKLVRYFGDYEPVDVHRTIALLRGADSGALASLSELAVLYLVVPAALVGPPTLLMGLGFPYVQRVSHTALRRLGRRLGILLATNIAGGVLGAASAGWLLLPWLGTAGTLKALVGIGALLAMPLVRVSYPRRPVAAAFAVVIAMLVSVISIAAIPDARTLWARLHAAPPENMIFAEDGAGVSVLKATNAAFRGDVGVFVNGLGQSWIPYGKIHTVLGALPALIHPAPHDVAIIGLGSGDTAFAAAGRADVRRLVAIEIIGAQLETLKRVAQVQPYHGLIVLLSDPRIEHRTGDGRAFLLQRRRLFDIIEADALRPTSAYAGNLYSREYFELLLTRLKPGGLAVTWAPTERIQRTFTSVFPHVLAFGDIYLGSAGPIRFDPAVLTARATAAREYYAVAGIDIIALLRPYVTSLPLSIGPDHHRDVTDLNTDMFPRDEFGLSSDTQ